MGLGIGDGCGLVLGHSAFAAVSSYPIVGSRLGLVLDAAFGGGFAFSCRWSALGLVSDVVFGGGFVLSYRWFALGVSFGRYLLRRFRPILSFVRVRCWFWTFLLAAVSSYPFVWFALGVGFGRYPN